MNISMNLHLFKFAYFYFSFNLFNFNILDLITYYKLLSIIKNQGFWIFQIWFARNHFSHFHFSIFIVKIDNSIEKQAKSFKYSKDFFFFFSFSFTWVKSKSLYHQIVNKLPSPLHPSIHSLIHSSDSPLILNLPVGFRNLKIFFLNKTFTATTQRCYGFPY